MTDITIETVHGSHTFRNTSCKVNVFALLEGYNERVFPNKELTQQGKPQHINAAQDNYAEHGKWYKNRYESKDGSMVLTCVSVTRNKRPYLDGAAILRLREDAPLVSVKAMVGGGPNAVYSTVPVFQGRADILSLEEAEDLGYKFPKQFGERFMDQDELDDIFDITELAPGAEAPVMEKIKTRSGEKAVMVKPEAKRRIRIRR